MYRGFNIDITHNNESDYQIGLRKVNEHKLIVNRRLTSYLSPSGIIDGEGLESAWFPQIRADVFISHSHIDEKLAITLAGWLSKGFGLEVFVDSTIWGYSNTLLKDIDNAYCLNESQATYNYEKRNYSTSHVHMMLSAALAKMMDSAECLFFLNTSNSISPSDIINRYETNSPWLYYEISISKLIRKSLQEHATRKFLIKGNKTFSELNESDKNLSIKYNLEMEHLTKITTSNLNAWRREYNNAIPAPKFPLDKLYELF